VCPTRGFLFDPNARLLRAFLNILAPFVWKMKGDNRRTVPIFHKWLDAQTCDEQFVLDWMNHDESMSTTKKNTNTPSGLLGKLVHHEHEDVTNWLEICHCLQNVVGLKCLILAWSHSADPKRRKQCSPIFRRHVVDCHAQRSCLCIVAEKMQTLRLEKGCLTGSSHSSFFLHVRRSRDFFCKRRHLECCGSWVCHCSLTSSIGTKCAWHNHHTKQQHANDKSLLFDFHSLNNRALLDTLKTADNNKGLTCVSSHCCFFCFQNRLLMMCRCKLKVFLIWCKVQIPVIWT